MWTILGREIVTVGYLEDATMRHFTKFVYVFTSFLVGTGLAFAETTAPASLENHQRAAPTVRITVAQRCLL